MRCSARPVCEHHYSSILLRDDISFVLLDTLNISIKFYDNNLKGHVRLISFHLPERILCVVDGQSSNLTAMTLL